MGATRDEVVNWAQSNEQWAYTLELCVELCHLHIQDAELSGDLSETQAVLYQQQNQDLKNFH